MEVNDYELLYYCHQESEEGFNLLVERYGNYIFYIINLYKKDYYFFTYEDNDLYNESLLLLYECIYTYCEDYNVKFSSYYLACLKRKLMSLIRNLASNKNKGHAFALSLDYCPNSEDLDLYNVIDNDQLLVNEQVTNNYLLDNSLQIIKSNLNIIEQRIVYYYLKGYTYIEIVNQLKIDFKKVDNTLQKYRRLVKYDESNI